MPSHAFAASLKSYYLDSTKGNPRITFSLSGKTNYRISMLKNPHRVVIDLPNGTWQADGKQHGSKPAILKGIRYGIHKKKTLRVVLDLKQAVKVKDHYMLSNRLGIVFEPYGPIETTKKPIAHKASPSKTSTLPHFSPKSFPSYSNSIFNKEKQRYKPLIVIDPGHGGKDPGAISRSGAREKDVTLRYAHSLRQLLVNSGKYRVYMTRQDDRYVPLKTRVAKSRKVKGDIFISLHADSHPKSSTKGLSVYTISEKRAKREASKLINKSDKQEVITGINLTNESKDVRSVLIGMVQQETKNTSSFFAKLLVQELGKNARLLRNTHRFASLAVLTGADIPSVLIELGYLSNAEEDALLRKERYRTQLTSSIKRSIDKFFSATQ